MMKERLQKIWRELGSLQGIFIFMLILLISNFVWKQTISGDEGNNQVLLFGTFDISAPFNYMVIHITKVVKMLLTILGYPVHSHFVNDICFVNHRHVIVVWGCTAIKQSFIFLCIMTFTQGPWKPKLWFVPLGLLLVYLFNLLRIFIISLIVQSHPEYFYLFHEILLKYLFYGLIFLYWMLWEEKFNRKVNNQLSV
ncbi:MAG: archaeosortase/exosortase family protein [Paludibacteraceae bacterium]|nr:archaeosortase/exosortase family protein [Paludibacteraceae bacterium]MBN2787659.1 archaeosortase/exosortase family protein [Paludibacteraceae bacterium]